MLFSITRPQIFYLHAFISCCGIVFYQDIQIQCPNSTDINFDGSNNLLKAQAFEFYVGSDGKDFHLARPLVEKDAAFFAWKCSCLLGSLQHGVGCWFFHYVPRCTCVHIGYSMPDILSWAECFLHLFSIWKKFNLKIESGRSDHLVVSEYFAALCKNIFFSYIILSLLIKCFKVSMCKDSICSSFSFVLILFVLCSDLLKVVTFSSTNILI